MPEPMAMDHAESAAAFDHAGTDDGPLVPVYEVFARGVSKLLGVGGTVFDLGSGSGRFLAFLARRRPDAQLLGLELSREMLTLGRGALEAEGLAERVRLVEGDMTDCVDRAPAQLEVLSCTLALHHLRSVADLERALGQIAEIRGRTGCAIWIADLVRLQDDRVMQEWLSSMPASDPAYRADALASEAAAWTPAEMRAALEKSRLGDLELGSSALLQVHWARGSRPDDDAGDQQWLDVGTSDELRARVMALRFGLRGMP